MSGPWEDYAEEAGPWSEFQGGSSLPRARGPRGRTMAAERGQGGSVSNPVTIKGKIGSPEYQRQIQSLRKGAYYRDPKGNVRRNDNPGRGNPIVLKAADAPFQRRGYDWQRGAKPRGAQREVAGGLANLNRGLAIGDELAAGTGVVIDALTGNIRSPADIGRSYEDNMRLQRGVEDDFTRRRPLVAAAARGTGQGATIFVPGGAGTQLASAPTRATAATRGAVAAATEGAVYGVADRGTLQQRLQTGNVNALAAAPLGAGVGALAFRATPRPQNPTMEAMQRVARQDPAEMRARMGEFRQAGINPVLADVVDDSGRGVVRATASRMGRGRQAATDFADARAANLPDRISQQARRFISPDARTPDEIREALLATRRADADRAFGAVRGAEVPLDPDTVLALRSPQGKSAIRQAANNAANSLDPDTRALAARLNRLADDALDAPGETRITVGMAQEISEALYDTAERARGPMGRATNETRIMTQLGGAVRNNARTAVPDYDTALRGYEANSRLIQAADLGEQLPVANTDEFVSAARRLGPQERELAAATARRSIERRVGENAASAPGFARRFSAAPEPVERLNALIGPERGGQFQNALAMEEMAVRNARDIAPRTGSQTALRSADAEEMVGNLRTAGRALRGDPIGAVFEVGANWWMSRGFGKEAAEEFTLLALDPARTEDAIRYLEQRYGPQVAQAFRQFTAEEAINAARLTRGAGVVPAAANQNGQNALATSPR